MDAVILGRRNKLQLQYLKDLTILHDFKKVDNKHVEEPTNFQRALNVDY